MMAVRIRPKHRAMHLPPADVRIRPVNRIGRKAMRSDLAPLHQEDAMGVGMGREGGIPLEEGVRGRDPPRDGGVREEECGEDGLGGADGRVGEEGDVRGGGGVQEGGAGGERVHGDGGDVVVFGRGGLGHEGSEGDAGIHVQISTDVHQRAFHADAYESASSGLGSHFDVHGAPLHVEAALLPARFHDGARTRDGAAADDGGVLHDVRARHLGVVVEGAARFEDALREEGVVAQSRHVAQRRSGGRGGSGSCGCCVVRPVQQDAENQPLAAEAVVPHLLLQRRRQVPLGHGLAFAVAGHAVHQADLDVGIDEAAVAEGGVEQDGQLFGGGRAEEEGRRGATFRGVRGVVGQGEEGGSLGRGGGGEGGQEGERAVVVELPAGPAFEEGRDGGGGGGAHFDGGGIFFLYFGCCTIRRNIEQEAADVNNIRSIYFFFSIAIWSKNLVVKLSRHEVLSRLIGFVFPVTP
mmetsp:Transcript_5664/g.12344  ORF Transcript_5664/g.12344 Transcript_5664/m.12344 type:complete len:465 (+) Transcript_5664:1095-2489(+)